jgi:selenocysteine lyase/cysteine desulfurase
LNTGTVRVSVGYFNSVKECYKFINVVKKLWICFIYFW